MNIKEESNDIEQRYRNLLITLARDAENLQQQVESMHLAVASEPSKGKQDGMRTIINCRNAHRARLLSLLNKNKVACRHFFGTTKPEVIADEEIILH